MLMPRLPWFGQAPSGVPQPVTQGFAYGAPACAVVPGWLHGAAAAELTAAGLRALALEWKSGSTHELVGQTDFILFPYTLCSNDSFKCSNPSPLWELCWVMGTDNKFILIFSP